VCGEQRLLHDDGGRYKYASISKMYNYKKKYSFFLKTAKMADFKPFKALSDGWRAKWHIMHAIHKDNI